MEHAFVSVIPIFFLIISGYVLKLKCFSDRQFWATAEKLTYYVLLPCLLILEISHSKMSFGSASMAIAATILATLGVGFIVFVSKYVFGIENSLFTSIFQGGTRYNSYVFLGLASALFGSDGTAIMGLFVVYMIILTNFLSIVVMNQYGSADKKGIRNVVCKTATNPLILSALLGVALNLLEVPLPTVLTEYMRIVGGAASPLSLMAVGAGLTFAISREKMLAVAYSSALKLIIMPLLTLALLKYWNVEGMPANIALLYASLPCAGNAYILARQMGGDHEAMAAIITMTVLTSIVTVTAFMGYFLPSF